ncbi:hypothetical protein J3A83DRAFT_4193262 [Scleroderma citrinum]
MLAHAPAIQTTAIKHDRSNHASIPSHNVAQVSTVLIKDSDFRKTQEMKVQLGQLMADCAAKQELAGSLVRCVTTIIGGLPTWYWQGDTWVVTCTGWSAHSAHDDHMSSIPGWKSGSVQPQEKELTDWWLHCEMEFEIKELPSH